MNTHILEQIAAVCGPEGLEEYKTYLRRKAARRSYSTEPVGFLIDLIEAQIDQIDDRHFHAAGQWQLVVACWAFVHYILASWHLHAEGNPELVNAVLSLEQLVLSHADQDLQQRTHVLNLNQGERNSPLSDGNHTQFDTREACLLDFSRQTLEDWASICESGNRIVEVHSERFAVLLRVIERFGIDPKEFPDLFDAIGRLSLYLGKAGWSFEDWAVKSSGFRNKPPQFAEIMFEHLGHPVTDLNRFAHVATPLNKLAI